VKNCFDTLVLILDLLIIINPIPRTVTHPEMPEQVLFAHTNKALLSKRFLIND